MAGFGAKLALFGAAIDAGYGWLALLAVVNSVVSLVYYLRVLTPAYFDTAPQPLPALGRVAAGATGACAAAVVAAGVGAELFFAAFRLSRLLPW